MNNRNDNGLLLPVGTLDPACPEAQWWLTIVGTLDVPLRAPVAQKIAGPAELATPQDCYFVAVDRLTADQVEGICKVMAAKFNVPLEEVREGVRGKEGLPIRADRLTTVAFDMRHFL